MTDKPIDPERAVNTGACLPFHATATVAEPVYLKVGEHGRILHLTDVQAADKQSVTRLLTVLHEKIGDLLSGRTEPEDA